MIRQSEGKTYTIINVKDPVSFHSVVNEAKLYELGLAPLPKSKGKPGKGSKSYCEQYAVYLNVFLFLESRILRRRKRLPPFS